MADGSNNKNEFSLGNESQIENTFPLGLHALLIAIEEKEGTQCNNGQVQSNKLNYKKHDVESTLIDSEALSSKSHMENKSCSYSPSELDVSSEPGLYHNNTMSIPSIISDIPITLPIQCLNQENNTSNTRLEINSNCSSSSSPLISGENKPIKEVTYCSDTLNNEYKNPLSSEGGSNDFLPTEICTLSNSTLKDKLLTNPMSNFNNGIEIKNNTNVVKEKQISDVRKSTPTKMVNELLDTVAGTVHDLIDALVVLKKSNKKSKLRHFHIRKLPEKSYLSPVLKRASKDENKEGDGCDIKCSECGEIVEILNDDPTFSFKVHLQCHKLANESKYLSPEVSYDKNVDYMCLDCNMPIMVYNKDVVLSFELHYSNCQHHHMTIMAEEKNKLESKFIDDVFFCLGDSFESENSYIVFDGRELYCKVCRCGIATSEDIFDTSVSLYAHLSLLYHKDLLSVINEAEQSLDLSKSWHENSPAGVAHLLQNNRQRNNQNQGEQLPRMSSAIPSNDISLESTKSSIQISNVLNEYISEEYEETSELTHITKFIPKSYNIHCKFFSSSNEGIYCNICSQYVAGLEYLKDHIVSILHKIAFFNEIKGNMPNEQKSQVKFLVIVSEHLFCTLCKVDVALLESFNSVCKEVLAHFKSSH